MVQPAVNQELEELRKLPLRERVKRMDAAYKGTRKDWKRQNPSFKNTKERFAQPRALAPDECSSRANNHTIESKYGSKKAAGSSAFKDKSAQRPSYKAKTDVFYDAQDPAKIGPDYKSSRAFRSFTPRMPEDKPLEEGQHLAGMDQASSFTAATQRQHGEAKSGHRAFATKAPRIEPPRKLACEGEYHPVAEGTFEAQKSARSRTKTKDGAYFGAGDQRPSYKAKTDAFYDPKRAEEQFVVRSARGDVSMTSFTPRFETKDGIAPPPGHYAPTYISSGMLA